MWLWARAPFQVLLKFLSNLHNTWYSDTNFNLHQSIIKLKTLFLQCTLKVLILMLSQYFSQYFPIFLVYYKNDTESAVLETGFNQSCLCLIILGFHVGHRPRFWSSPGLCWTSLLWTIFAIWERFNQGNSLFNQGFRF